MSVPVFCGVQKKGVRSSETEVEDGVSLHVGLEIEVWSSARAASALNFLAISLALYFLYFTFFLKTKVYTSLSSSSSVSVSFSLSAFVSLCFGFSLKSSDYYQDGISITSLEYFQYVSKKDKNLLTL